MADQAGRPQEMLKSRRIQPHNVFAPEAMQSTNPAKNELFDWCLFMADPRVPLLFELPPDVSICSRREIIKTGMPV
jgi:hypothetical protein